MPQFLHLSTMISFATELDDKLCEIAIFIELQYLKLKEKYIIIVTVLHCQLL